MKMFATLLKKPSYAIYFNIGLALVLGLVFMYMYFLSMSVVHVVLRKEINQNISTIESEIAQLEASYILAQHKVSNKIAALENFTENDKKIFVSRQDAKLVYSGSTR